MLVIGAHLPISKGFLNAAKTASSIGANTFQFFTRNPRGGNAKQWDKTDIAAYAAYARQNGFGIPTAHAPYTLNPAAKDEKVADFARKVLAEDLERLEDLPLCYYNFHPGSHVGQGEESGVSNIAAHLNAVLTPDFKTIVLLETMAGKGTEIGGSFESLARIIDKTVCNEKIGVCLDTCHVSDAGYDIVHRLDGVLEDFDKIIGLNRLKAIHLNDSKNPSGARKDRHEKLGNGFLGKDALRRIVTHEKLKALPFYLETPNELDGYAEEISWLKSVYKE